MVHIRQPFFSIITATVFSLMGLMYGISAGKGAGIAFGTIELNMSASWALTGVMFLMAYFALVHIKD